MNLNPLKWFKKTECISQTVDIQTIDNDPQPSLDIYSPTWRFIEAWAKKQLNLSRELNDSRHIDYVKTSAIRGNIEVYKDILNLPKPDRNDRAGILSHRNHSG